MNIFQYGLGIVTAAALIYIAVSGYHWHKGTQLKNVNSSDEDKPITREELFLKNVAEIDKEIDEIFREYTGSIFKDIFDFLTQRKELSMVISQPFYDSLASVLITRGLYNEALVFINIDDFFRSFSNYRGDKVSELRRRTDRALIEPEDPRLSDLYENYHKIFNGAIAHAGLVKNLTLDSAELNFYRETTGSRVRSNVWPLVLVVPGSEQQGEVPHLNEVKTDKITEIFEEMTTARSGYTDYLIYSLITSPLSGLDNVIKELFLEHVSRKSNIMEYENFKFEFSKEAVFLSIDFNEKEKKLIEKYTVSLESFGNLLVPALNDFFSSFLAKFEQESNLTFLKDLTTVKVGEDMTIRGINCSQEKTFTYTFFLG